MEKFAGTAKDVLTVNFNSSFSLRVFHPRESGKMNGDAVCPKVNELIRSRIRKGMYFNFFCVKNET
jgi:hypothetical protein